MINKGVTSYSPAKTNRMGTIGATLLTFLLSFAAATQQFASDFNYNYVLGQNIEGWYAPWSIVTWYAQWGEVYPQQFIASISAGVVVGAVLMLMIIIINQVRANSSQSHANLYGSAKWAQKSDIEAAGLLHKKPGLFAKVKPSHDYVYVGAWQDKSGKTHYLKHNGAEHVLCFAPTRSGKGVGLVIPTLLSWGESAVITDLKGELWSLTSGWRKQHAHNKVIKFEPAALSGSACWNPLDEIRLGTEHEVGDVQNLATLIVDPDGRGLTDHWQKTAQSLLVGLILHVLYKAKNELSSATLSSVDVLLTKPGTDISEVWAEMESYRHVDSKPHPVVRAAARDMLDRPVEEGGSVLSTAKSYLALYRDPVVAKNIERSDFKVRDLMHSLHPVSLYIVTHPNDKARLRPLVRILLNMIVRLLADKLAFTAGRAIKNYQHRLLLMLDEFPSLGKLEILQESLAYLAGYGIKGYLICQDINQLKSREIGYGHDESITSNCHIQNAFAPNRLETAEHLSKLTGQTTVIKEQITTSGNRLGLGVNMMHKNVTRTMHETQRALITPDECMRLPGAKKNELGEIVEAGDMVVYVAGFPAIYGKQPLYFNDAAFSLRAQVPAPESSDTITR